MTQLAFATVYVVDDENEPLLDLHLEQTRRNTPVPYKIYAAVQRLQPRLREKLAARDDVLICDCEPTDECGGLENSHYTTQLVQQALEDGATHVAIMHMDAFPVRPDWFSVLDQATAERDVLAAICATEDLRGPDEPMSAFIFTPREFHERWGPVPATADLPRNSRAFRAYMKRRSVEASDPYGLILHSNRLPWRRMLRSNAATDHPVLAGIYDDLIFHLNAGTRRDKRVVRDFTSLPDSPTARVRSLLRPFVPRSVRDFLTRRWRTADAVAERVGSALTDHERIRRRLLEDPDGYLAYLRGIDGGHADGGTGEATSPAK